MVSAPCCAVFSVNDGLAPTALRVGVAAASTFDRETLSKYQPFGSPQQMDQLPPVNVSANRSWIWWPANWLSDTVLWANAASCWLDGGLSLNTDCQVAPLSSETSTEAVSFRMFQYRLSKPSELFAFARTLSLTVSVCCAGAAAPPKPRRWNDEAPVAASAVEIAV